MKNAIKEAFHSPKFVTGFVIFIIMLSLAIFVPIFAPHDPLEMVTAAPYKPGTYISVVDAMNLSKTYELKMDVSASRLQSVLSDEDKAQMMEYLTKFAGIDEAEIPDVNADVKSFMNYFEEHYDNTLKVKGLTNAKKQFLRKLSTRVNNALKTSDITIAEANEDGELEESKKIKLNTFVNVKDVNAKQFFLLGTDPFGRDEFIEVCSAIGTSLKMGLLAGVIATFIGLTLGLLSGYLGGTPDNIIVFFTNLFTVIPSFVLIVLISFSLSQSQRSVWLVGVIIGITSWPWTARSVRSQVISLRNRDHVNMSKISGHSLFRIICEDILPYVASYVIMALILQISSAILSEAQLSMLGLGPSTTKVATLGLMMNWAMTMQAHLSGQWWAFMPVILSIALVAFSMNLMNTGLDQVFNPQLRD